MSNHHLFMHYQYTQFIMGYTDFLYVFVFTLYASTASNNGKLILNKTPVSAPQRPFTA